MSRLIDLGCRVADVHHRYHTVHSAVFGAASLRLVLDAILGRRRQTYQVHAETLKALRGDLAKLDTEVAVLVEEGAVKATEREVQHVLLDYVRALDKAVAGLLVIFENLQHDESAYRDTGADGRSGFTRDKLGYDRSLSELERLGTRLNRLFASY